MLKWGRMWATEWRYFASPWSTRGRDTDVREQKIPRERRAKSAHFSASHCETQFMSVWVSNWLCILTSLHIFFCPASLDICCENYDPGCADGMRPKDLTLFVFSVVLSYWALLLLFWVTHSQMFHFIHALAPESYPHYATMKMFLTHAGKGWKAKWAWILFICTSLDQIKTTTETNVQNEMTVCDLQYIHCCP